ncbi:hypothetical protein SK3146_00942 [Paenibacillus konkukensis]|uniref:Uncharacterized protein n=1 Tax=Paenibacillus konkukensis TaxID=2020716 RepID=A0ABY4RH68_9BACL|nr:hypothetical protein [Paenibacillus konkukensis]UQZ81786.1 hypothetical protein SK3146_00942 [Paenibacillus konkukensis]
MKIKKLLTTFVLIISLLSFSQSAFAASFTPFTWSTLVSEKGLYCNDIFEPHTYDDGASYRLTSLGSSYCFADLIGTTNVTNANQLKIHWNTEAWESGDIPYLFLQIQYYGHSEEFELPWNGNDDINLNMGGYSGPVDVMLSGMSTGGKRLIVDFYIGVQ